MFGYLINTQMYHLFRVSPHNEPKKSQRTLFIKIKPVKLNNELYLPHWLLKLVPNSQRDTSLNIVNCQLFLCLLENWWKAGCQLSLNIDLGRETMLMQEPQKVVSYQGCRCQTKTIWQIICWYFFKVGHRHIPIYFVISFGKFPIICIDVIA